jgi:hypothetical protein
MSQRNPPGDGTSRPPPASRRRTLRALVLAGVAAAFLGVFVGPRRLDPDVPRGAPALVGPDRPHPDVPPGARAPALVGVDRPLPDAPPGAPALVDPGVPPRALPSELPEDSPRGCYVEPLTAGVGLELLTSGPAAPGRTILRMGSSGGWGGHESWIVDDLGYVWSHPVLIGRVPRELVDDMRARMRTAGKKFINVEPALPLWALNDVGSSSVHIDIGPPGAPDRVVLCESSVHSVRHHASPEAWWILRWFEAVQRQGKQHPALVAKRPPRELIPKPP